MTTCRQCTQISMQLAMPAQFDRLRILFVRYDILTSTGLWFWAR